MTPFTVILFAAIVLLNLPLLFGGPMETLVFRPDLVAGGEFWRLFTHPFVHVSLYHFVLDAGAFVLLWLTRPGRRTAVQDALLLAVCGAGSLAGAMLWNGDLVAGRGFCGLSGIGHGLMAYQGWRWAMDRANDRATRRIGAAILAAVLAKSLFETYSGGVVFTSLHLGPVGAPAVGCHLGGALGGLLFNLRPSRVTMISSPPCKHPRSNPCCRNTWPSRTRKSASRKPRPA